jgi:hypothetical protein
MKEPSSAHVFYRQRDRWLAQVMADHELTPLGFKAAYAISAFMNRETLEAWPGQQRLADQCGVTKTGVRNAIAALVSRGHLTVVSGGGRDITSRYAWVIKNDGNKDNDGCTFEAGKMQPPLHVCNLKDAIEVAPLAAKRATAVSETCNETAHKGATSVATTLLIEPTYEHRPVFSKQDAEASASKLDEDPKAVLFGDGLRWLVQTTGKSEPSVRGLLGKMLQAGRDDAGAVLAALRDAKRNDRADPVSWIIGSLKARTSGRPNVAPLPLSPAFTLSKPGARA